MNKINDLIEDPNVFIPWDVDEKGLQELLGDIGLEKIAEERLHAR